MSAPVTSSPCDLQGRAILVTRPIDQATDLCELITQANGEPVLFPTVSIEPSANADQAHKCLSKSWDIIIFISRNAVKFAAPLFPDQALPPRPPAGPLIAAVGAATARALQTMGRSPDLIPNLHFDSEGLLELPELNKVAGRKVLIVRGEGGRPLLGDALTQRRAQVSYAEVYRRALPKQGSAYQFDEWRRKLAFLTATSDEVLHNLYSLVPESEHHWLQRLPLAVYSSRTAARAMELGFRVVAVAPEASDHALIDALCRLALHAHPSPHRS